jgi:adenylylsulfate kinase
MSEARARSFVKSLTWRAVATATTVLIVLLFTGRLDVAVAVGGIEVIAKLAIFYVHERVWQKVDWGME